MQKARTAVMGGLVLVAAVLPTMLATGDDGDDRSGRNWWAADAQRSGTANFQPDGDLFTVCDETSDGDDVVGTVYDGTDVVYTVVADGGSGDCERHGSGDGDIFNLHERKPYAFEVCLSSTETCKIMRLTA